MFCGSTTYDPVPPFVVFNVFSIHLVTFQNGPDVCTCSREANGAISLRNVTIIWGGDTELIILELQFLRMGSVYDTVRVIYMTSCACSHRYAAVNLWRCRMWAGPCVSHV